MKTNHSARRILRIRNIAICLALVGMVGAAFWIGEFLAKRVGQFPPTQTEVLQPPNASFANLIAAAQ